MKSIKYIETHCPIALRQNTRIFWQAIEILVADEKLESALGV